MLSQNNLRILYFCGILSSVLYIGMNILIPFYYEGYDWVSQTVSELSAIDAPTRTVWVIPGFIYTILLALFGWGVLKSAGNNRPHRLTGIFLTIYGLLGIGWAFAPMHLREVIGAGGATLTDTMHIVFSIVTVSLMFLAMGFGAYAWGRKFRIFSAVTIVAMMILGYFTGRGGVDLDANLPTPMLGLIERILIFFFLLWVIVLALILLRQSRKLVPVNA